MSLVNNFYQFKSFQKYKNVIHGISTREFGSMKKRGIYNFENIKKFLKSIDVPAASIILAKQIHSGNIFIVKDTSAKIIPDVDCLITTSKNIFPGIVTADCLPILLYDKNKQIVAAVHAGYKGLNNKILQHAIDEFVKLGANAKDIIVGIGPGIGKCCYDIGKDRKEMLRKTFPAFEGYIISKDGKDFLDLQKLALLCLIECGIKMKNIETINICTKDNLDKFFSYRGEGIETYGEFISVIGML